MLTMKEIMMYKNNSLGVTEYKKEGLLKIIGYIGLAITGISGLVILLIISGILDSPPINSMLATFIIGQSFFNGYVMGRLESKK